MDTDRQEREFTDELNRRIAILTSPEYEATINSLDRVDYILIGVSVVLSILIFIWGWY